MFMFGLSKLVETTLQNLQRIDKIWPTVSEHLIVVTKHKVSFLIHEKSQCSHQCNPRKQVSSVRNYGVESLAKIIEASLTKLPSIPRRSFSVPSFSSKAKISQFLYDISSTPADAHELSSTAVPVRSPAVQQV